MKKIAIIASNNGLGHINRCVLLGNQLSKKFNVTIFCSKDKAKKFDISKKIKINNFEINLYKEKIYEKKNNIHKFFNFKKKYDLYLSDNYPELIHKNNNSIILSNFFWHDVLKINTNYYKRIEKKILNRPIVPNYLFCSKYIKKRFNINPVGFYGNFKKNKFNNQKNGILLSFGTAESKNKMNIDTIEKYIKNRTNIKYPVYLEPKFFSHKLKKYNVIKATYDNKMYSNIAVAIIRPGLGTVTNCLAHGITIITHIKNENKEFIENAKILEINNIGVNFFNIKAAINFAILIIDQKKFLRKKFEIAKNLKWNGELEVIKIIQKIFENKVLLT